MLLSCMESHTLAQFKLCSNLNLELLSFNGLLLFGCHKIQVHDDLFNISFLKPLFLSSFTHRKVEMLPS
jgi:hypothetical protein